MRARRPLGLGGTAKAGAKGGTIRIVSTSDFDYVDTALAYFSHSWNMMGATNLTLLYYPHKEGTAGPAAADGGQGFPKVAQRW